MHDTPLKILIIVRAGRDSLHPLFAGDCGPYADIAVSTFEDVDWSGPGVKFTHYARGGKYQGVSDFFAQNRQVVDAYDYFWFFEDDLEMKPETLAAVHGLLTRFRFMLAAPALTPDSHFSWTIAVRHAGLLFRGTDFVEQMAPIMSREFLRAALPHFAESYTGFGYEWLWQRLLLERGGFAAILDSTPIRHGRPLGSGMLYKNRPEDSNNEQEVRDFINKFGLDSKVGFVNRFALTNEDVPRLLTGEALIRDMTESFVKNYPEDAGKADWCVNELMHRYRPRDTLEDLRKMQGFSQIEAATEPELIVAFRTHVWNADVAYLARRLLGFCVGARFVVLVDESNGVLDTAPFEKVAHDSDFSGFGMPNFPAGQVLWYNADYPLYVLRRQFPNAACFAMVEYDVAINVDIAAVMRRAVAEKIDLIAHELKDPPQWWTWEEWTGKHFAAPIRRLLPVLILSGRGVDALYERRRRFAAQKWPETPADWAYCEVFIPSAIAEIPEFRIADIDEHAKLSYYTFRYPLHFLDPLANTPGNICHPVLGSPAVIQKHIVQDETEAEFDATVNVFDPQSLLRRQLALLNPADFMGPLTARIKSKKSPELLERFAELARAQNWPANAITGNLALGKPATQSSVNPWFQAATPALDAAMGNNGKHAGTYGFQTAFETDPWWQVDLQGEFAIGRIVVFNRLDNKEACRHFSVSSSTDNQNWHLRGVKLDDEVFGGADGKPYAFVFEPAFDARFVRVQMIGEGHLHLDEIEVYEEQAAPVIEPPPPPPPSPPPVLLAPAVAAPAEEAPRYHTAVVVCARWETDYIEEWLTYYQCIGYEHVYLYCNDDDPAELYEKVLPFTTGRFPFVTFTHFEGQGLQYAMYMHFIENFAREVKWVSFLDVDEFLRIADGSTIDKFLLRFDEDANCILFNWRVFGTSGHKTNPPGKVLENYTKCAGDINSFTKFIGHAALLVDGKLQIPDFAFGFWHSLFGKVYRPVKVVNVLNSTERKQRYEGEEAEQILQTAVVHHYLLRSEEAARLRVARGTKGDFSGQSIWDASKPWVSGGLNLYNDVEDLSLANFWKNLAAKGRDGAAQPVMRRKLLSRGKPCTQSTISEWSTGATLEEDAGAAVNGKIDGTQKFHTQKEINPWWQVDLEEICSVTRIVIYNAAFHTRDRLRNFELLASDNASDWGMIHVKADDEPVGSLLTGPFIVDFAPPLSFRYLRIMMLGENFFHLDQVEIYGEALPE